jgi:hypothetical protein
LGITSFSIRSKSLFSGDRGLLLRAGFPVAGEEVEGAIGVDVQDDLDLLRLAGSTAGWLSSASVTATTDGGSP